MAIILNVGIVLIWSSSKVITYILISTYCLKTHAHCFFNMCEVLELSCQVCRHRHNKTEMVETRAKGEANWTDCRGRQATQEAGNYTLWRAGRITEVSSYRVLYITR